MIDLLRSDKSLNPSTKGAKATAYRDGYTRSIKIHEYWVTINYDRKLWLNNTSAETPFWVAIRSGTHWEQPDSMIKVFNRFPEAEKESLWEATYLAPYAKQNAVLEEVVRDIAKQIMVYIDAVETGTKVD